MCVRKKNANGLHDAGCKDHSHLGQSVFTVVALVVDVEQNKPGSQQLALTHALGEVPTRVCSLSSGTTIKEGIP
jgi:hypothetical protein